MRRNLVLPHGQVTGIGSLPHRDPEEAVRFVAAFSPAIPFWPQLPQRSPEETMLLQVLSPLADLVDVVSPAHVAVKAGRQDAFRQRLREVDPRLDEHSAAGFFAFERACAAGAFPAATALKGQLTGPITLAHCLFMDGCAVATLPAIYNELVGYLCRLGVWQITRLRRFDKPLIIFIDEPALDMGAQSVSHMAGLRQLIRALQAAGSTVGVHCCASSTPTALCAAQPDIISFDAYQSLEAFLGSAETHAFMQRGGWLAFGMIPTLAQVDSYAAAEAFMRWVVAAEHYDLPQLASHALVTATCGLGLLDLPTASTIFRKCHELSALIMETARIVQHN